MVRLKQRVSEMSVLKSVSIRCDGMPETDVWVAILKTAVSFNSSNPLYDGFYYKDEIIVIDCNANELRLKLSGGKEVILNFGSPEGMEIFSRTVIYSEGIEAPCSSPLSSATPSPPKSTPSITTTSSPPSSSE